METWKCPPPTFLGFALVGAFVFVGWSCYRESFPSKKGLLVLLRFSGLALLVLALLQPQVHFKFEKKGESRVFALLDRSESMSISDDGDESRWGKAIQAFSGSSESVLAQLGDDHEIEVLTVGNELKSASVEGLRDEAPQAGGSAIGSAMDELKEKDVSAVLLFSDMAWNEGIDPVGVAGKLGRRGWRSSPCRLESRILPMPPSFRFTFGTGSSPERKSRSRFSCPPRPSWMGCRPIW